MGSTRAGTSICRPSTRIWKPRTLGSLSNEAWSKGRKEPSVMRMKARQQGYQQPGAVRSVTICQMRPSTTGLHGEARQARVHRQPRSGTCGHLKLAEVAASTAARARKGQRRSQLPVGSWCQPACANACAPTPLRHQAPPFAAQRCRSSGPCRLGAAKQAGSECGGHSLEGQHSEPATGLTPPG